MNFCNYCYTNKSEIEAKDAEIVRLRAALDAAFDFANAHSLPCLEDAMKIALEATEHPSSAPSPS